MDDRTYLKQGLRKSSLPVESKPRDYDITKPSTEQSSDNVDEGLEVIVMRNQRRNHSKLKSPHSKMNEGLASTRTRGRSPSRNSSLPQKWPSFIETESIASTSSSSSTNVSIQRQDPEKYSFNPKSRYVNPADTAPARLTSQSPTGTVGSRRSSYSRGRSYSKTPKNIKESSPSNTVLDDLDLLLQSVLQDKENSPKASSPRRGRSLSQSRHSRHSSRTRSHSRCRTMGIEEYTFAAKFEPNIHENAIMNKEVKTREIIEMNENELFARKAGLSL